jgi:hypothetical protein
MIRRLRQYRAKRRDEREAQRRRELACERLARIVETTRNSFENEQYRRHRQAALKGLGRG